MAQKSRDVFFTEFTGVTFAMEKDETADPIDIALLSANAVTLNPQMPADPVEKFLRPGARGGRLFFGDAKGRE
jgi:hypothetical protein